MKSKDYVLQTLLLVLEDIGEKEANRNTNKSTSVSIRMRA